MALIFDCPCERCRTGRQEQVRLVASIDPPLDGGQSRVFDGHALNIAVREGQLAPGRYVGCKVAWRRTGSTFDDLTLSPSLNYEASHDWHGFITNGEAR